MSINGKVTVPEKASFEIPPPPIPTKDIKKVVNTDVVVLGAGVSGLTAALSAAEAGAKVIQLEKGQKINYRGLDNAAIASRKQIEAGIKNDKDDIISTIMQWGAYRTNQQVVKLWADHCDEVMDWLTDMYEVKGDKQIVLDMTTKSWFFPNYPVIHLFFPISPEGSYQVNLVNMLANKGKQYGVDLRFETPAVQLLRKDNGRVTGVIAKNKQGEYIQFIASKAVVLCTGDYGSNREMVEKYCDWRAAKLYDISTSYANSTILATGTVDGRLNTGDGHKMGLWAGAAIDDAPHCPMYFDRTGALDGSTTPPPSGKKGLILNFLHIARQPWLQVDINGERFMNEDLPWGYEANQIMQQPELLSWTVWDDKYEEEWPKMRSQCCKNLGAPTYQHQPYIIPWAVKNGAILTAETIEELAQKMKVPVKTFKATVYRYNELARGGKDLDFGKHPDRLTTIEKPRFYACKTGAQYLVILGGLKVNNKLQVLDTGNKPIPGLYAAGNVSGSFFGDMYPTTIPGLSHSRAWTFGRLAGLAAAAETA